MFLLEGEITGERDELEELDLHVAGRAHQIAVGAGHIQGDAIFVGWTGGDFERLRFPIDHRAAAVRIHFANLGDFERGVGDFDGDRDFHVRNVAAGEVAFEEHIPGALTELGDRDGQGRVVGFQRIEDRVDQLARSGVEAHGDAGVNVTIEADRDGERAVGALGDRQALRLTHRDLALGLGAVSDGERPGAGALRAAGLRRLDRRRRAGRDGGHHD